MTWVDPFAGKPPNPGMLTELALVVVQLRVTVAPLSIVSGCALKEIVGVGTTVTVADDAAVPPDPVAVAV